MYINYIHLNAYKIPQLIKVYTYKYALMSSSRQHYKM